MAADAQFLYLAASFKVKPCFKWFLFIFLVFYISGLTFCELLEDKQEVHQQSVSKIINDFGCLLFPQLQPASGSHENVIYSPLSIMLAISMVYLGASNTTASEIRNTLFRNQSTGGNAFHEQWRSLFAAIGINNKQQNVDILSLANGLWFDKKFEQLQMRYQRELKEYYDAHIHTVDFSKQESITGINDWVSLETKGKIQSIMKEDDVNEDTVLILVNVLFFKSLWKETFLKEDTYNSEFFIKATSAVDVKMMRKKSLYDFYEDHVLGLQVIKLPYVNGAFAMFIALPQDSLSQIQKSLTSKQLEMWERSLYRTTVDVHLPKFTVTASYKLEQVMKELGISEIFDIQRANLSGISQSTQLHISSFFHKSFIEVDEEGTEAAAVSAMHLAKRSIDPTFKADHPFIFWIKHIRTETIFFLGQVAVPNLIADKEYDHPDITEKHIEL